MNKISEQKKKWTQSEKKKLFPTIINRDLIKKFDKLTITFTKQTLLFLINILFFNQDKNFFFFFSKLISTKVEIHRHFFSSFFKFVYLPFCKWTHLITHVRWRWWFTGGKKNRKKNCWNRTIRWTQKMALTRCLDAEKLSLRKWHVLLIISRHFLLLLFFKYNFSHHLKSHKEQNCLLHFFSAPKKMNLHLWKNCKEKKQILDNLEWCVLIRDTTEGKINRRTLNLRHRNSNSSIRYIHTNLLEKKEFIAIRSEAYKFMLKIRDQNIYKLFFSKKIYNKSYSTGKMICNSI